MFWLVWCWLVDLLFTFGLMDLTCGCILIGWVCMTFWVGLGVLVGLGCGCFGYLVVVALDAFGLLCWCCCGLYWFIV